MVQVHPMPSWETQLSPGSPQAWPLCCPRCCGCGTAACWGSPRRASCSLTASQLQTTMDWQTHICIKEKAKQEIISFFSVNPVVRLFPSGFYLSFDSSFDFFKWFFWEALLFYCFVFLLNCSCVLKRWSAIRGNSVWQCVLFGLKKDLKRRCCSLGQKRENTTHSNKPQLVALGKVHTM